MASFTMACACRVLAVLLVLGLAADCGASCIDNHQKIVQLFGNQGVTVSGCTDAQVKTDCSADVPEDAIPSRTTKVVCCKTCFEINAPGLVKQSGVQYTTAYGLPWVLDIVEKVDTDAVLPLAVIVHGGGFKGGARISNEVWAIDWANRGYRVINVDYPLCKHYWRGTDHQQHPWGATSSLTGPGHPDCDGGLPQPGAPAWFSMNMAEVASRAVRHAVKWAHDKAAEGTLKIDTSNTVCHGSSAGSLTCLQTFLYNTTVSYANDLAATEQAAAGLPQQTNLLAPDPDLDYIKLAAHVGMSFGDLRNVTQETVDAMAPGASAWVIHDWKDEWPASTGLKGEKMAGVRNLGRMLDEFGVSNAVYVLDEPNMPRGPPGNPYMMKQHGLDLEKTLRGDVLEGMHTFVAQGLASATREPAPGATSPTSQTTGQTTQPTGQTTGQTTQTSVCTDNNAAVIAEIEKRHGLVVSGCADGVVKARCDTHQIKSACCQTCGGGATTLMANATSDATTATTNPDTGTASSPPVVTNGSQPVTTASSVCKDNNQAVIALATKQNLTISGCGDEKVKSACSKFTELLEKCCETCEGVTKDSAGGASPPKALGGNPFASNKGSITATAQSTTGPLGGDSSSCARRSRGRRVILQAAAVVVAMAMC